MQTKINLSRYEKMYDTFDPAHNREHMEGVRKFAIRLAKKYCPDKLEIIYVAATLHDIGLSSGPRKNHEKDGYLLIKKDKYIKEKYSEEDFNLILEAVKEHRTSTGNPKSIVAKIISDADRAYVDIKAHMKRSYYYNSHKYPNLTHNQILNKVAEYIVPKFDTHGTGTRLYFEESREQIVGKGKDIIKACKKRDYKKMDKYLNL